LGNAKTTIELNGKQYDAITGRLVGQSSPKKPVTHPVTVGKNMDGFFGGHSNNPQIVAQKSRPSQPRHHQPLQVKRSPERAKTLMRHVVKKPKPTIIAKSHTSPSVKPIPKPKAPADRYPSLLSHRLANAKKIAKSPFIQRFTESSPGIAKKLAPLKVKQAPAHVINTPPSAAAHTPALPLPPAHKRDLFADALKRADSHKKLATKTNHHTHSKVAKKLGVSSKILSFGAASTAALLIGGFIAYQNVPNFAMRIASTKAGFNASMPGYKPSGFALNGSIQSSPGLVTLNFKSNTDARSFAIIQRPSGWNSESLLNNFVANGSQPYQTYQDKGRTIYVYGDSNATWVNGGVWYQIEGKSSLSNDQLLSLANSI
jgi:hypothetical protein